MQRINRAFLLPLPLDDHCLHIDTDPCMMQIQDGIINIQNMCCACINAMRIKTTPIFADGLQCNVLRLYNSFCPWCLRVDYMEFKNPHLCYPCVSLFMAACKEMIYKYEVLSRHFIKDIVGLIMDYLINFFATKNHCNIPS